MTATVTELPVTQAGPVKDFLLQLLDDALESRIHDGHCIDCRRAFPALCQQHEADETQAKRYKGIFDEVDETASDARALGVFLRAVVEAGS